MLIPGRPLSGQYVAPTSVIQALQRRFARRRDRAFELISELFDCQKSQGAFYLLPTIARYANRFASGTALAEFLLERTHVAVVPGEVFFAPGHVRISFTTSGDRMEEGVRRMRKVLAS